MAGLTFVQIQAAVMGTRFDESQRGDVKTWINDSYFQCWHAERWTFRKGTDLVTVTTGSSVVSGIATDVERVDSFLKSDGSALQYLDPRPFQSRYYNATSPLTGPPESYTIINGAISVGPVSNETKSDYLITYEKAYTALVNDGDVAMLPEGSHEGILVFGAIATGCQTENDFTWQFFQQKYDRTVATLQGDYLVDQSDDDGAYPRDPIGAWW
jgi:hypothetical protein